jgi:hypothetical protein
MIILDAVIFDARYIFSDTLGRWLVTLTFRLSVVTKMLKLA